MKLAIALLPAVVAWGCGPSVITADRIERAIEPTFANLVEVQVAWLQIPPMAASDVEATASCRRRVAGSDAGSGDWVCRLRWLGPDRQALRDTFDVVVATDGCYTATAEGEQLGGLTLRSRGGREVRNLLHAFEGCFEK
jgi:ABC-2 type transport system permease protein